MHLVNHLSRLAPFHPFMIGKLQRLHKPNNELPVFFNEQERNPSTIQSISTPGRSASFLISSTSVTIESPLVNLLGVDQHGNCTFANLSQYVDLV